VIPDEVRGQQRCVKELRAAAAAAAGAAPSVPVVDQLCKYHLRKPPLPRGSPEEAPYVCEGSRSVSGAEAQRVRGPPERQHPRPHPAAGGLIRGPAAQVSLRLDQAALRAEAKQGQRQVEPRQPPRHLGDPAASAAARMAACILGVQRGRLEPRRSPEEAVAPARCRVIQRDGGTAARDVLLPRRRLPGSAAELLFRSPLVRLLVLLQGRLSQRQGRRLPAPAPAAATP